MKVKAVIRRPRIHYLFIFGYLLAPVANVVLLYAFTGLPLNVIMSRLWNGYGPLATIWLFTAPLMGLSLFFVHKVTWYLFIAHSSLILLDFVVKWIARPGFYAATVDGWMNVLIFVGNLLLVGAIGYIVQRDFRAPYFQVLQRHWREKRRIPINHHISLDGTEYPISDISEGGCFVPGDSLSFAPGDEMHVELISRDFSFQCRGRVMRVAPTGVGIKFIRLPGSERRRLNRFLKTRFGLRYRVNIESAWTRKAASLRAKILDLSSGGAYLEAPVEHVEVGDPGELNFKVADHSFELKGRIAWVNPDGAFDKPVGFGVQFTPPRYLMSRHLVKHHSMITLSR